MVSLAAFQSWPDAGVKSFSQEEETRIMRYPIPGENKRPYGSSAIYYPRKPIESPSRWFANHTAKLLSLLRAEGM